MRQEVALVRTGHHIERAGFHRRVRQREPHSDHVGVIGFWCHDAMVLVPECRADDRLAVRVLWEMLLRRLDSNVLHWIRRYLRTDEVFEDV